MSLIDDVVIDEIAQTVWKEVHNQPEGFFEKFIDKIGDNVHVVVLSKLLKVQRDVAQQYYIELNSIAEKVKHATQADLNNIRDELKQKSSSEATADTP